MFEKLSGEYNRGYTKAIQDLQEVFKYVQPDLKYHHKNLNNRTCMELLKCCLDNREKSETAGGDLSASIQKNRPLNGSIRKYRMKQKELRI